MAPLRASKSGPSRFAGGTVLCVLGVLALQAAGAPLVAQAPTPAPAPRRNIAGPGDYLLREKIVHLIGRDEGLRKEVFRIILVNGGAVFSGNISNCALKRRALTIAASTRGIVNVTDEMTVPRGETPDADLAKAVTALLSDAADSLALKDLDVQVADGVLTLQGKVKDIASRASAEEIAGAVPGITRIANRLRAANAPSGNDDASLQEAVLKYVGDFRNFNFAGDIRVKVEKGVVILTGKTGLYIGRQQAVLAAAQVQGIVRVENRLSVDPSITQRGTAIQAAK